jgi:hypothetical protein
MLKKMQKSYKQDILKKYVKSYKQEIKCAHF